MKPLTKKKLDAAISAAFKQHGNGIQFPIMDTPKIWRDVVTAYQANPTLETIDSAMVAAVEKYRCK